MNSALVEADADGEEDLEEAWSGLGAGRERSEEVQREGEDER